MGVLTNCISAGHANWARAAFIFGVDAIKSGIDGAIRAGTLKEAKIVTLSRRQKSVYDILGIWGGAFFTAAVAAAVAADTAAADDVPDGWHWVEGLVDGPNSFAKRASLYTQMDMLTVVVVRNFAVPGVTVEKGWLRSVDVTVSIALAVKYVPPYRV